MHQAGTTMCLSLSRWVSFDPFPVDLWQIMDVLRMLLPLKMGKVCNGPLWMFLWALRSGLGVPPMKNEVHSTENALSFRTGCHETTFC